MWMKRLRGDEGHNRQADVSGTTIKEGELGTPSGKLEADQPS